MHYLSSDPLTSEEESYIHNEERRFNFLEQRDTVPTHLSNLLVRHTANGNFDTRDTVLGEEIKSDYFKIDIRNKPNAFLINTSLYGKIQKMIKRKYGMDPVHNSLVCTSITIVPVPNKTCSLYYEVGANAIDEQPDFNLVGSFVCDDYLRKLPVQCPFVDSFHGNRNVCFNWYDNDKRTGKIVPRLYETNMTLPVPNGNIPFVHNYTHGSYYIEGICDSIGFNVSFMINVNARYRSSPSYQRASRVAVNRANRMTLQHVPSHRFRGSNGVDYIAPSQDYWYDPNEPDPILEAFRE